jgi:serine/threonine protein kinase
VPDFTFESFTLDGQVCRVNLPSHPLYGVQPHVSMSASRSLRADLHAAELLEAMHQDDWEGDDPGFDRLYHISKLHRIMPRPPRGITRARSPEGGLREECLGLGADGGVFLQWHSAFYPPTEEEAADTQPSIVFNRDCIATMRAHQKACAALVHGADADADADEDEDEDDDPELTWSAVSTSSFLAPDSSLAEQHHLVEAALHEPRLAPFFVRARPAMAFLDLPVIFEYPLRVGLEPESAFPLAPDTLIAGRYLIVKQIGEAAFSRAVEVLDLACQRRLCLKVMNNQKDLVDQCLDEAKLLRLLNQHDPRDAFHIIRMRSAFYFKEHLFLGSELLGANLHDAAQIVSDPKTPAATHRLRGNQYFCLKTVRRIARQLLVALWYLRCFGVLHCDLKPENVLMQDWATARVKLIDFGSASFLHDSLVTYIQSRSYRAPEVILGLPCLLPSALDMWSLGCVLYELYAKKVLFSSRALPIILARMHALLGPVPADMIQASRYGPRYYRAVPVPLPPGLAHLGANALIFQIFQRRPAHGAQTRNTAWSRFAPPEDESPEEARVRALREEEEWVPLDTTRGPHDEEDEATCEEALLDPRPSSLLQRVLATARAQQAVARAAGCEDDGVLTVDGAGEPTSRPPFDPLSTVGALLTCHPTLWPGHKLRPRDWADDTPARIEQFMRRRRVTSAPGIERTRRAHADGQPTPGLDPIALADVLCGTPVTDEEFPANPAFARPQFFGTHHPANLPPHESPALFANFLAQLLRYRPEDRPTPEQALLHPFLWPVDEDEEWDL